MLVAYFDESGTHGNSRIVTLTGLVGRLPEWTRLEAPWRKRLGDIKCFHAVDCAATDKAFSHLNKTAAAALSADLSTVLADHGEHPGLVAISGGMYRDDWRYAASDLMKREFLNDPFIFCCVMAIQQVCSWSEEFAGGEPVAFVFAKQDQYNDYMKKVALAFDQVASGKQIGHVGFGTPECLIQLQAADLFAYEIYRELDWQLDTPNMPAPNRENLSIFAKKISLDRCQHFKVDELHKFAIQRDEIEKNKIISSPSAVGK